MSEFSAGFHTYLETQNRIYNDSMRTISPTIGVTEGIQHDPGTDPQGAFLVAWRHPEQISDQVEEVSAALGSVYRIIAYNRANAHTTLSDHGLKPELVIDPEDFDQKAILDAIVSSVRDGLDAVPRDVRADRGISFGDVVSNRKAVLALGQPTEATWEISEAVKHASRSRGIVNSRGELGLNGSWGNHMTLSRFVDDSTVAEAKPLRHLLNKYYMKPFGDSIPTAIEVGYFHTDPTEGFDYTTYERFEF